MPTIAIRVHRSRKTILSASEQAVKLIGEALDEEAKPMLLKQFYEVVKNWTHKVIFKARKFIRSNKIWIDIFPSGENADIWKWVSRGTRAHKIRAKNAPLLAFMWGGAGSYKAKTRPGGGFGGPGVVMGGTMHFAKEVDHPGNEGRKFEEDIAKTQKPEFSRIMQNAWRRIIRTLNK